MHELRRPSFDDVIDSARQGSPWALGCLYRRFQPGLLRMLAVIAPHQCEDLASDVWLEVAASLSRFEGDEKEFRAWLAATARGQVIDAARRSARRPDRSDVASADALASFAARVVAVLPHDQADVVLLRVLGGLDVDDVARTLHKQPGAVRSLQQRALRRLARQLDPEPLPA
jgi:RNA polymerase sigma-70 factor (ECF subfamily)